MKYLIWATRVIASVILLQTLFFKFTAAPESVYIFEALGAGAAGRIGSGVIELIVAILLLTPKYTKLGSLGTIGAMGGAIMSHILILGIVVQNDDGTLFALACITLVCAVLNLVLTKEKIKILNFEF